MWLVLEGIDGAGKTTLANELCRKHLGYSVLHVGPPGKTGPWTPSSPVDVGGSFRELARSWTDLAATNHIIWDRGPLGNWVYQEGAARMSLGEMRLLEAILLNHNGFTALLNTDPKVCHERRPDTGLDELYTQSIKFQQACHDLKSYWSALNARGLRTMFADWQKYDSVRHMDSEGVGSNSPHVWILGEQRNGKAELQVPFSSTSGMRLIWPWINPLVMRVSNVLRPGEDLDRARNGLFSREASDDLYFRWATLDRPHVLTLGHVAQNACIAAGVRVDAAVEHPQHVWRFQQAEADHWRDRLALKVGMMA